MIAEITVNVDEKLAVNKFNVDEGNAHIVLKDNPDPAEFDKLILCCPAGLYKRDAEGAVSFDYASAAPAACSAATPSSRNGSSPRWGQGFPTASDRRSDSRGAAVVNRRKRPVCASARITLPRGRRTGCS